MTTKTTLHFDEDDSVANGFITRYFKAYEMMQTAYKLGIKSTSGIQEGVINKVIRDAEDYYRHHLQEDVRVRFQENPKKLTIEIN